MSEREDRAALPPPDRRRAPSGVSRMQVLLERYGASPGSHTEVLRRWSLPHQTKGLRGRRQVVQACDPTGKGAWVM